MRPGRSAVVFESKEQAAAIRIAECNHGVNDLTVGRLVQVAFEFNGRIRTCLDKSEHVLILSG